ncbi:hypothetical protein CW745_05050 [Psychromonas sp. psych-6C06]|uniref:YqcC family protein n=1 Tax=Psychromonas sp. psych-6C06 TaxID=2058089 RepID=UPI000C322330|nr:YqcC family protein [Psychromonas sp. psych-6C06]PKF62792.1 hypothetical protein CW745_05050 [Psychromonas sp. psych-6C06]
MQQIKRQRLASLLSELEALLRKENLWQSTRPSEQALASEMPFAIDTLQFPQWLQFIFIEKMTQILQLNLTLPNEMSVAPMASEYFKTASHSNLEIVALITRIDLLMNEKNRC